MTMPDDVLEASERYIDRLFGPGAGKAHTAFLDTLKNPVLVESLHRAHAMQADESVLSVTEHYLIGLCVLCATKNHGPAAMFAKTLRHLGVTRAKIAEAVARLSVWIGPVPAAEAMGHVGKALDDYDQSGVASMKAWFPGFVP
jgi:hypothetical protein